MPKADQPSYQEASPLYAASVISAPFSFAAFSAFARQTGSNGERSEPVASPC